MFSSVQVWNAFNEAWRHLMEAGQFAGFPYGYIPSFSNAPDRYYDWVRAYWPRFQSAQTFPFEAPRDLWGDVFDWAGWPEEPAWDSTRIFLYPLTIQGHFDGGGSADSAKNEPVITPSEYRVVFTDAGLFLGVVRYRAGRPNYLRVVILRTEPRDYMRAGWLAPVDSHRMPIATQDERGRWNYPGVPIGVSQRPENFLPPLNVALASVMLARWDRIAHRGSQPPPRPRQDIADPTLEVSPPQLDDNDTLYMPGLDDVGHEVDDQGFCHFDWSPPGDNSTDLSVSPAEDINPMDCHNARYAVNMQHQVSCETTKNPDNDWIDYYIAVTGTGGMGYGANGWCKKIIDGITTWCGTWNFNLATDIACSTSNATLKTFFIDRSIRGDFINDVSGTELYFSIKRPWFESDDNHECVAQGIQKGSCASIGIQPLWPVTCRTKDWFDLELTEWDWVNLGNVVGGK